MSDPDAVTRGAQDPPADTPTSGETPRRRSWGRREYSPEEIEEAKQAWRDVRPWEGPMQRADKVLIGTIGVVTTIMLLSLPLRPMLLASHPVALAGVTGSTSAVGAGGAFAAVGGTGLWLVVLAGTFGKVKFDWLYWWAGRRWGARGVKFFIPSDRAARFVERVRSWPSWSIPLLLVAASLPGIPSLLVFLLAGLAGTRLLTFLVFNALGAGLYVGLVAWLGYSLGQSAVDVVLAIDRYALWITLGLVVFVAVQAGRKQSRQQKERAAATTD